MTTATPHRLPLRTADDTTGMNRDILSALEGADQDLTILRLLANSPTLLRPMVAMANALMQRASLPAADREVVVLYISQRLENLYEWNEHVPLSAAAGITDEQRTAIRGGAPIAPPMFTAGQQLGVGFADEILDTGAVSDSTWDALCRQWNVESALDLLFSVAFWGGMVPIVIAGLGLTGSEARS